MTTDPKYAVRVNDFLSSAEASKVAKIICNGRSIASGDMLRFAVGWAVMANQLFLRSKLQCWQIDWMAKRLVTKIIYQKSIGECCHRQAAMSSAVKHAAHRFFAALHFKLVLARVCRKFIIVFVLVSLVWTTCLSYVYLFEYSANWKYLFTWRPSNPILRSRTSCIRFVGDATSFLYCFTRKGNAIAYQLSALLYSF